jgi:hypothetical protein
MQRQADAAAAQVHDRAQAKRGGAGERIPADGGDPRGGPPPRRVQHGEYFRLDHGFVTARYGERLCNGPETASYRLCNGRILGTDSGCKTDRANNGLAPSSSRQLRAHVEPSPAHPVRASDCAKRYHETAREPSGATGTAVAATGQKPHQRSTQPAQRLVQQTDSRAPAVSERRWSGGTAGVRHGAGVRRGLGDASARGHGLVHRRARRRSAGSARVGCSDARAHTDAFVYCARLCGRDATDMFCVHSGDEGRSTVTAPQWLRIIA